MPSEDGIATLAAAHIPSATANSGFGSGTWNAMPNVGLEVVGGEIFTITYIANAVTPPETPITPTTP